MDRKQIIVTGFNPAWQKTLFFREYISGKTLESAFASALSPGTASCLTAEPARFELKKVPAVRKKMRIEHCCNNISGKKVIFLQRRYYSEKLDNIIVSS